MKTSSLRPKAWCTPSFSGALVWEDFVGLTVEAGFLPPVTLSKSDYVAYNDELQDILKVSAPLFLVRFDRIVEIS